jgi:quinol monooxygenase YgiN
VETLVYVDRSRIEPDKAVELEAAVRALVEHVAAADARVLSYAIYFSRDRSAMTVVHVHRDSDSLEELLALIAPVLAPFGSLLRLESIDVYGSPSEAVLARLRSKTELLGGTIAVHMRVAGVEAAALG